jgi:hypothetical protein
VARDTSKVQRLNAFQTDPQVGDIWEVEFSNRQSWVGLALAVESEESDHTDNPGAIHFRVKMWVLQKATNQAHENKVDTWNMWHHDKHEWFLIARI